MAIYGYCRISQKKQNIERQVRNILSVYQTAIIIREAFTGRKIEGRKEWEKIYRTVRAGDMIVFDSVSRFSRNAEEGFELYQDLYNKNVDLVFLKEPQINTETFKRALDRAIPMTGTNVDFILDGINRFLLELAKDQIRLAFEQAEKEVEDLRQRTREGIVTARLNGKQIGARPSEKRITKKSVKIKGIIEKHSSDFNGNLSDVEIMQMTGVAKNTYYKYKKELKEQKDSYSNEAISLSDKILH